MTAPKRVLLADDHVALRAGTRLALEGGGFVVCAEAGSGPAAVAAALRERPDVCLLDIHMPGGDGIEAASRIAAALPGTPIVMLTVSDEDEDLFRAVRAGASGYLLKDMDPDQLPAALNGVLAGDAPIPAHLVSRLLGEIRSRGRLRQPLRDRGVDLTEREWETLEMLRADHSTKSIAERLGISEVTVRRHISGILQKLGVPDRAAALALLDAEEQARRPPR